MLQNVTIFAFLSMNVIIEVILSVKKWIFRLIILTV